VPGARGAEARICCLDWVLGEGAGVAVGSHNGAIHILGFKPGSGSSSGGVERAQLGGNLHNTLGQMQVLVRVSPPGGCPVTQIACCAAPWLLSSPTDSETTGGLPRATCLVATKGRGIWSWVADRGLVRVKGAGDLGGHVCDVHMGNVTCLAVDGSGSQVASLSSDGGVCVWSWQAAGAERGAGGDLALVSRFTCDVLLGSNALLGGALSYHGCFVALAGRRVAPQRGRQSLTFPTGLEGVLTIQRVPGRLASAPSRAALLSTACAYMHRAAPAACSYGIREPAGGIKWWWDLALLAEREMQVGERRHLVGTLAETRASLLKSREARKSPEAEVSGGGGTGAGLQPGSLMQQALGAGRGALGGVPGARTPLHTCVKSADELTCELLLLLAAVAEARDHKGSTALMIAALRGHEPTVKALLRHGRPCILVSPLRIALPVHLTCVRERLWRRVAGGRAHSLAPGCSPPSPGRPPLCAHALYPARPCALQALQRRRRIKTVLQRCTGAPPWGTCLSSAL